jgi:hypothetical protein
MPPVATCLKEHLSYPGYPIQKTVLPMQNKVDGGQCYLQWHYSVFCIYTLFVCLWHHSDRLSSLLYIHTYMLFTQNCRKQG